MMSIIKTLSKIVGTTTLLLLGTGELAYSGTFDFAGPSATDVDTFSTTFIPLTITQSGIIEDLNLEIILDTDNPEELDIALRHNQDIFTFVLAAGETVSNSFQDLQVTFDDEADQSYSDLRESNGIGTFQPANPLDVFDGSEIAGLWELIIENDMGSEDGDNLISWRIFGTTVSESNTIPESSTNLGLIFLGLLGLKTVLNKNSKQS